jgi:hypothetical protein
VCQAHIISIGTVFSELIKLQSIEENGETTMKYANNSLINTLIFWQYGRFCWVLLAFDGGCVISGWSNARFRQHSANAKTA